MMITRKTNTNRHGMLLIEVLAAVLILGGSVVTLLVAQSRAVRQNVATRNLQQAGELAEQLLARWRLEEIDTREPANGTFRGRSNWSWTRSAEITEVAGVDAILIELSVNERRNDGSMIELAELQWLEMPDVSEEG